MERCDGDHDSSFAHRPERVTAVGPQSDRVRERFDDRGDGGVNGTGEIGTVDVVGRVAPGHEFTETWTALGIDLGPSCRSSFSIRGPGSVVHADESRHGEQRLARDRTAQRRRVLVIERVAPAPEALAMSPLNPRAARIGRKAGIDIVMIDTGEMDAVVMKKDLPSVRLVAVADEVLRFADGELDTTTNRRETIREGCGECCRRVRGEADREQIDVRFSAPARPVATDPYT